MVGDRVHELGPQAAREPSLELIDLEPLSVQRDGDELRLEAPECLDRSEVRRPLDDHEVARIEERFANQLERLDRTTRDQELFLGRTMALQRLEPTGERVEGPGEAARRRVLEGAHLAACGELLEQ